MADRDYLAELNDLEDEDKERDYLGELSSLSNEQPVIEPEQGYTPFGVIEQDVEWTDLHKKDDWIRSSQHFFEMTYGYVPQKGDKELEGYSGETYREKLADYGLKQMAGFNYNIGDMAIDSSRVMKADQKTKEAFVYMLDQYDAVNMSWHTTGQAGWEMMTDVTNWLGLATLGTSAVAGQAAKLAGKEALRQTVKASLKKASAKSVEAAAKVGINTSAKRVGALAGTEGAAHAMASDAMMQNVRIDAGSQDEYDTSRTLLMGTIGAAGGAAIGTALNYGVGKLASKYYEPKIAAAAKKNDEAAVAKQILAEKKLADAKAEADTIITKAVDDEVPSTEVDKLIKDQVDDGLAVDAKVKTDEPDVKVQPKETIDPRPPKARISPKVFTHAHHIFEEMKTNPEGSLERFINDFETHQYTPEEFSDILRQINAADELAGADLNVIEGLMTKNISDAELNKLKMDKEAAQNIAELTGMLRKHANAYSGRNLQEIQDFMTYRKKIADAEGKEFDYEAAVKSASQKVYNRKLQKIIDEHDVEVDKALKAKDYEGATKLRELRDADPEFQRILDEMAELDIERTVGVKPKARLDEKFLEASISGVFSPSTIIYNTVFPAMKVAFYPMLDTIISDPLNRMAWKKSLKIYSQMQGSLQASLVSARAAARYEQTMLTADPSRFLEGGVKIESILGSTEAAKFMRFFPRLVGASDAFSQEIAAVASLTADGFDRLLDEAVEKGLKGKDIEKYIDANIQKQIDKGYDFHVTEKKLKPIYELGARKGKTGKDLEDFVNAEVKKMGEGAFKTLNDTASVADLRAQAQKLFAEGTPEAMRLAKAITKEADSIQETGEAALDSVQTLLYKKDFSADGALPERMAKAYEDWTRDKAWSRAIGNLFFRTPAWLFHESMRLTPAVNSLLPQFRNDMAGINGPARAARAKTEAAVAYSWMLYVITKYAEGSISGSPNVDYTMTGEKNKSTMRPLTIKDPFFLDGGREVSFARWEPLRIPATIVTNALEGYLDYQEKKNMDGVADDDDGLIPDEIMATFGVGFATAISAIRDSALTQGVSDTVGTVVRFSGLMESPEGEDKAKALDLAGNFILDKVLQVVPSSISKFQEATKGNAPLTQPNGIKDKLIKSVNPYSTTLPRRYDTFGWAMEREISYAQVTGFGAATSEDLSQGRSKDHMTALDYLAKLENLGYGNFTRQKIRDERFPDKDLRSIEIVYDGKNMSLFDAMMQELAQDKVLVKNVLFYANAVHLPMGSPLNTKTHGIRVTETKKAINDARTRALDTVILRNQELNQQVQDKDYFELLLQSGASTNRGNIPLR
jgi:ethanolamine utilization microcompartment shell protein EutS